MTVSRGSLGVWWGKNAAVYIYKNLFTKMFTDAGGRFTISAMPESCRKALGYMGSHSRWNGDKWQVVDVDIYVMEENIDKFFEKAM